MAKGVINQCGPGKWGLYKLVPNWCFAPACNMHDLNYSLPGSRKAADDYFFKEMLQFAIEQKRWILWYVLMAYLYYFMVRTLGGFFRKSEK